MARSTARNIDGDVRALKDELKRAGGEPADVHVSGAVEEEDSSAASDEDIRAENKALKARLEEQAALRRKWVDGDYRDMSVDHPFEVTLFEVSNPADRIVKVCHNGREFEFVRGMAKRVPRYVVDLLNDAKEDYWSPEILEDGTSLQVNHRAHRFPFSAHPVYGEAP